MAKFFDVLSEAIEREKLKRASQLMQGIDENVSQPIRNLKAGLQGARAAAEMAASNAYRENVTEPIENFDTAASALLSAYTGVSLPDQKAENDVTQETPTREWALGQILDLPLEERAAALRKPGQTPRSETLVDAEEPAAGPPLEPLEAELPTLAPDVPQAQEEVRINPYTGQPFKTSQDTRGWQPRAVNDVTGQVMDPYHNVYREQTLLGGLVTAAPAVRGPRYTGYSEGIVQNPFADSTLTPEQQSQQAIVQRAAREKAGKDRQAEAYKMFGAKWKAAQKFLADPMNSPEQKRQVSVQMQQELASFAEPSPLDSYMAALAEDSVETQVALAKDNYRKTALSLGASPEEADALAGKATITDGRADYSYAERHLERLYKDHERSETRRLDNESDREKSLGALMTQLFQATQTKSENDIMAYYALLRQHNVKWPFQGPQPDPKQGFSPMAEYKRLSPTVNERIQTQSASPTEQGIIDVRTQADIDRARQLVEDARSRGDRNFLIRLRDPETQEIKTIRAF